MGTLHTMSAGEFVRRLRSYVGQPDRHYVFWLGAGCSVTSKIPAAAELVRQQWLPELQRIKGGNGDVHEWTRKRFPEYEQDNPGALYGAVMDQLFPLPEERQRETERLCDGPVPGFGYGVLAALMSRDDGFFSAALTTNFDDLVADAMYVYGARRPLVIQHESLAGFVRPGRVRRPLVVKVHGDHRLNPMHTARETEELKADVADGIRGLLHDRGLIFVGYSGNDRGVIETLEHLPRASLPLGVWWVSVTEPVSTIRDWLGVRDAVWVQSDGFDELMLLFRDEFQIAHPTADKFERMIDGYRSAYERLTTRVSELSDSAPDATALKDAARRATTDAKDWWGIELEAQAAQESDPTRVDEIYRDGLERFPDPRLMSNYALYLQGVGEYERSEELYERAVAADPENPVTLGNFALLLKHRGDYDRATEYYERAIAASPDNANNLGNYGVLLADVRRDYDRAQQFYERAIAAHPEHANTLGNYANLLTDVRGEHDRAQELYERAITAEPKHANNLANYATFLSDVRGDHDRAEALYQRAVVAEPGHANNLGNYARLCFERREDEQALDLAQRALDAKDASPGLRVEIFMYLLAVGPSEGREDALTSLAPLVQEGVRSPGWDFSRILARAREDGDPRIEFLEKLADVISERADLSALERFEDWA